MCFQKPNTSQTQALGASKEPLRDRNFILKKNIVFILIFVTYFSFGQNQIVSLHKNNNASFVEKRIDSLFYKLNELQDFKKQQEEIVKQTTQTISNQNSVISSFGTIYTILTILITVVSIGLPILMYQFGIKPSRNALRDLELNVDKKVENYLSDTRAEQIKKSVEHLKGNNIELKSQAISFLSLTVHEGYSEQQLFEFYRLLKSDKLNDQHKWTMAYLLASKKNDYADEIFNDEKLLDNLYIKQTALQYISLTGFENFIKPLKYFLDKATIKSTEFLSFLSNINLYNSQLTFNFFNCKELIDHLDKKELCKIKSEINFYIDFLKIDKQQYQTTYLNQQAENACT